MRTLHYVEIRVFYKEYEGDKLEEIINGLKFLIPLDFEKEKIKVKSKTAYGFEEKKIVILTLRLKKSSHIRAFLNKLNKSLNEEQKLLLIKQLESRLDDKLHFFIRFDKHKLINEKKLWITDSGRCFHIKMSVVAYPRSREKGKEVVRALFGFV